MAAGGLHVDEALHEYLNTNLKSHGYSLDEIQGFIRDGMKDFQQHGKRTFLSSEQVLRVRIAGRDLNNDDLEIANGVMLIPGYWPFSHF